MTLIINIIVFLLVLGIIILIHEAGHFFFAKKAGILCHEFAIGMGPVVWQKSDGETDYSIRAIPIGGFVSMAGEAVSDAMFKKDETIGLLLEDGIVTEIVLYDEGNFTISGVVKDFDLYGKNMSSLYIEIETASGNEKYEVSRSAKYRFNDKKTMWITPEEKSFESKSLWARFITIFGGPLMNFVLAFILFFFAGFFILQPNYDSNAIGEVSADSVAANLNLEEGDLIKSINGVPINSWYDLSTFMADNDSTSVDLVITRDGQDLPMFNDIDLATYIQSAGVSNINEGNIQSDEAILGQVSGRAATAGLKTGDKITMIDQTIINNWDDLIAYFNTNTSSGSIIVQYERDGSVDTVSYELIGLEALESLGTSNIVYQIGVTVSGEFNLGYSLLYAPKQIASDVGEVFTTLGLLFGGGDSGIGVGDLSGPVGIFSLVSRVREEGFITLVIFMGFLSINIGMLNLLPIPALDGGRLIFLGFEAVTRKPVNKKFENYVNLLFFFALMAFFIFVTFNDVFRLIKG